MQENDKFWNNGKDSRTYEDRKRNGKMKKLEQKQ